MKIKLILLCAAILGLGIPGFASAEVTGSGTFDLIFPSGVTPTIGDYRYGAVYYTDPGIWQHPVQVDDYFGGIGEQQLPSWSQIGYMIYGLSRATTPYQGHGAYDLSAIWGSHDPTTGSQTLAFSAKSPDPGNVIAQPWVDLIGYASFSGTLAGFGYAYSFTGSKDNPSDLLAFGVVMEIKYNGATVFSNYEWGSQYWMENRAYFPDGTGTHEGIIDFSNLPFSSDTGDWSIMWDFKGDGWDTAGGSNPVPEPTTMLLLGLGFLGLVGVRKIKK
jgi:hypothetical protein